MEHKNLHSEFNTFIINHITRLYRARDFLSLMSLGLSRDVAERVANMSQIDTLRLSDFPGMIAHIQIREPHLEMMIRHVQHEGNKDRLIDECIQLDASQIMLKTLTAMDSTEYRERREALGLPKATPGRPTVLSEQESTKVHNAWQRHQEHEELYRYYLMAMDTGLSLARIWHHMQSQHQVCPHHVPK
jgi:hypothetical protein